MKYQTVGNCPHCDAERGVQTAWGMSPEGWARINDAHKNGHPENSPLLEDK